MGGYMYRNGAYYIRDDSDSNATWWGSGGGRGPAWDRYQVGASTPPAPRTIDDPMIQGKIILTCQAVNGGTDRLHGGGQLCNVLKDDGSARTYHPTVGRVHHTSRGSFAWDLVTFQSDTANSLQSPYWWVLADRNGSLLP